MVNLNTDCCRIDVSIQASLAYSVYESFDMEVIQDDDYDVCLGMLISSLSEGERVARVLGDKRALLLRDHGVVVVGESVPHLVMGAIYLRDNAAIQFNAILLGNPKYLSYEEGRQATKVMTSALSLERAWTYWVARAKKAFPDLLVNED
ncbi:ribulose-5-phosphate 4-epimerase-like epimerase or aldolase [Acetomicrobium mobile DSM 13181]|uniref:Ribulose-5-phosphate 4-epimerase-like epimerase or aldolase n=1 Tax=Acetomicrobium mobile (strain ATCC BAA-54 / DSM 13181 / JCM 12221 / NGA) TaxID=891968 RepID=I4BWP4_ACEMN|nr:ribulose-5-phosphate 4-epimerase-like epimerase or aldolase [Acetomicrobium mobile DSM 13181]